VLDADHVAHEDLFVRTLATSMTPASPSSRPRRTSTTSTASSTPAAAGRRPRRSIASVSRACSTVACRPGGIAGTPPSAAAPERFSAPPPCPRSEGWPLRRSPRTSTPASGCTAGGGAASTTTRFSLAGSPRPTQSSTSSSGCAGAPAPCRFCGSRTRRSSAVSPRCSGCPT
jgi:hypothetical protein